MLVGLGCERVNPKQEGAEHKKNMVIELEWQKMNIVNFVDLTWPLSALQINKNEKWLWA